MRPSAGPHDTRWDERESLHGWLLLPPPRPQLHTGTLEIPTRYVQRVSSGVHLGLSSHDLRQVLPEEHAALPLV